jgi:hypothetical protein
MHRSSVAAVLGIVTVLLLTPAVASPYTTAEMKQLRETGKCPKCNLREAELGSVTATDLRDADLSGTKLYYATLRDADLTGATMVGTNLKGADLFGAKGAKLSAAITNSKTICPDGYAGPCN